LINLFQPEISEDSSKLLHDVFKSKWLGRGLYVDKFEDQFALSLKVNRSNIHTIASCSDAIFGVFNICNFKEGSEVLVPSISFPAIASAILAAKLKPRIVDIDIETGNISLDQLDKFLSKKTVALFVTHYGGIPVDIKKIRDIVGPNVMILEDAACAFGTYNDGVACGTEGDFGCWSFDSMKLLTCGEGGGFYFKNKELLIKAKEFFYLGLPAQAKSGIDRQATESRWWEYQLNSPGRRSVFTNINAAIGLPQFENLNNTLARRSEIRNFYSNVLDKLNVNYLRQDDKNVSYANYFFTLIDRRRDELASYLKEQGVYTTFRYYPLHAIKIFSNFSEECKSANLFSETALNIPIHQALNDKEINKIGSLLENFFAT
jgi:dTDP-4-amino-4,6-dideoxygalactose transaminase